MVQIRVLLVDDNFFVRQGLRMSLETFEQLLIVGEAANGAEAVSLCEALLPDVMLLDVMLGKEDGIGVARHILSTRPTIKIIMLSGFLDEKLLSSALSAGAQGYMMKNVSLDFMKEAISEVWAGKRVLCPEALKLFQRIQPVD